MQDYYREYSERLNVVAKRGNPFGYLFSTLQTLCSFLEIKSTLGIALTNAYRAKDNIRLQELCLHSIPECIVRMDCFYENIKAQWQIENHSIGFEVLDVRIGGVRERLIKSIETVKAFINGDIERIEELEQERLTYYSNSLAGHDVLMESYRECASGSDI